MNLGNRKQTSFALYNQCGVFVFVQKTFCVFGLCLFVGCTAGSTSITSEPAGAIVWLNDREVGRTPLLIDFLYGGEYDVRLEKDGFEPVMTSVWGGSSEEQGAGVWHFDLEPRNDDIDLLIERARKTKARVVGGERE